MAGNYKQLKAQIAKLQEEAAAVRKSEAAEAVATIKSLMAEFDLTAEDLGFKTGRRAAVKGKGVAKYRDPETGKTWTGRGKPPAWMAGAVKAGKADAFLIEKVVPAAAAKPAKRRAPAPKKAAAPAVAEATGVKKKALKPVAKKAPAKAAAKPKAPRRAPKKAAEVAPAEAVPPAESSA